MSNKWNSRRMGKTAALDEHLKRITLRNPDTVVVRCSPDGMRVEKPVKGTHEIIRPRKLTHQGEK